MNGKKKGAIVAALLLVSLFIRLFSANPSRVETCYSTGVYPYISAFLKYLFGWLPFSIGDLLYLLVIGLLLLKIIKGIKKLFQRKITAAGLRAKWYPVTITVLLLYISFNLLWGINYNRQGITTQLGIRIEKYSTSELITIDSILLEKINESKASLIHSQTNYQESDAMFAAATRAYAVIAERYPFLKYRPSSIKNSFWGWAGNYIGFTGYYNPFSGEAQLNNTVPKFLQPYTSCHEIAHQLGYAKENEANFVGYLAASASDDSLLHYSVYLDLFLYTQRNLFDADSAATKRFSARLLPEVKEDLLEWKKFNRAHRSPLEPLFRLLYGAYLRNNQQPSGILSYDEVTGFLVAYYKKFGRL